MYKKVSTNLNFVDREKAILDEVLQAKARNPELDVKILVDWHRAQRNLLGAAKTQTHDLCSQQDTSSGLVT